MFRQSTPLRKPSMMKVNQVRKKSCWTSIGIDYVTKLKITIPLIMWNRANRKLIGN